MAKTKTESTGTGTPPDLSKYAQDFLRDSLRKMILIRRFEESAGQQYGLRKIGGFFHPYNGQEAVAVGTISTLDLARDSVLTSYRDHGHALLCGVSTRAVMAELFGKITGVSRGKGGSMHMFNADQNFYGGNGIVGAQIPMAAGVAFASAYRKDVMDQGEVGVTLCYFGDGAIHQGAFHESANLAAIWNVPVVFIVENNQFGMGTAVKRVSAVEDFDVKAKAYNMEGRIVDGMDFFSVYENFQEITRISREERRPILVDVKTYRYRGHSISDPAKYRTKEELEKYKGLDPIITMKKALLDGGVITEDDYQALDESVKQEVKDAVAFADESPEPALETMFEDVLVERVAPGSYAGAVVE